MKTKPITQSAIREAAAPYARHVYWDAEDNIYVGQCPELFGGGVHGDNEAKVYADLIIAIEDVVSDYLRGGKPLPRPRVMPVFRATLDAVHA